jgi:hypothetical protein
MESEKAGGVRRDELITIGDLENFKTELLNEMRALFGTGVQPTLKQWLRSSEVRRMLGISAGTLQTFRVNGTLSHTKVGGIVFYKHDEIVRLLESNLSKSGSRG